MNINFLNKHKFLSIILIALVFGLGGGVFGSIITKLYLVNSSYDLSSGKYGEQGFVISNPKNVIVQQDAKIDEIVSSVSSSLVGIYKKQKPPKEGAAFSLDNYYKLSDSAGQGFIITSDGWIVTAMALDKNFINYVVITQDKKIYSIENIANDKLTGFTFLKVAGKDFSVRKLAAKSEIRPGNLTVGVNWAGLSWISSVLGYSKSEALAETSDNFSGELLLAGNMPPELAGSIIFNLAGDALGIFDAEGELEPMAHLTSAAESLFKNKSIRRPSLGFNFISFARLAALENFGVNTQKGAVIYKDQKGVAVIKNSAAEKAGLKEGDVIVSIDNLILDKNNDLADIIMSRAPGDKIVMLVERDGAEKEIEVVLGEQK